MLSKKTLDLLDLSELQDDLEKATAPFGGMLRSARRQHAGRTHTPAPVATPPDALPSPVRQMRDDLLGVASKLDTRLDKAIGKNLASARLRYFFVAALGGVVLVAIILAIARESPTLAALGSVIPGGAVALILQNLKGIQDEQFRLEFLIGKYEPAIVTCTEVPCLARVAERMQETFETLGAPSSKAVANPEPPPPADPTKGSDART